MITPLHDPKVRHVLDRVHREAKGDLYVLARAVPTIVAGWIVGRGLEESARGYLKDAFIPIAPGQGNVLYALARAARAETIVEFGTSFGVSTLYLAAAVRDQGRGRVIGSELEENKRAGALANLRAAGLADWAEVRGGDARDSLADLARPIDLLFLDGWKDLYLPVLRVLEPKLRRGALVLADDTKPFRRRLGPYLAHVRSPDGGYISLDLPVGDGLEVSLWAGPRE